MLQRKYPKVIVTAPQVIHKQSVTVFVPCALSGVLNTKNVSEMRTKIVAGSANNQIANPAVDSVLYKLGILYAPDYAINAGGIISVADEMEHGTPSRTRILKRIANIRPTLRKIFNASDRTGRGTGTVANEMAEKIFNAA